MAQNEQLQAEVAELKVSTCCVDGHKCKILPLLTYELFGFVTHRPNSRPPDQKANPPSDLRWRPT